VLGKALFENITIQPQFAHFFLAFMHGRYNFMNLVNDLRTLDEGLYKNLMFLKTYSVSTGLEGSVGSVGLRYGRSMDCRFHVVSC
jgi:HECT-domain (ubiquitin-transferase)